MEFMTAMLLAAQSTEHDEDALVELKPIELALIGGAGGGDKL